MNEELGDRVIFNPRGKSREDDLADCILRAAPVFFMDGQTVWITDGKRVPIFRDVVYELCRRFVVTARPVERGGKWAVEYRPFVPDQLMVQNLIRESLPKRAPVVLPEVAPPPPEPELRIYDEKTLLEIAAGKRAAARWAGLGSSERLQQEIEAGQRAVARAAARQGSAG
jgi:hypothetical protein